MASQTHPSGPGPLPAPAPTSTPSAVPVPRGRVGRIVAVSLATGLIAALLLVAAPFVPAREGGLTGAVLVGFAVGWAMLIVLSARFTAAPQRWAVAPAVSMGSAGSYSQRSAPRLTPCSTGSGPPPCWCSRSG